MAATIATANVPPATRALLPNTKCRSQKTTAGVGDVISAAGPVKTGSYGEHQIHALELHVAGG